MNDVLTQLQLRGQVVSAVVVILVLIGSSHLWRRKRGHPASLLKYFLLYGGGVAILAGRFAWVATTSPRVFLNPFDLIRVQSGIDLATASLAFALFSLYRARRQGSEILEFGAIAVLLAPALYAGLCLFRGDCYGRAAHPPWGMRFGEWTEPRLPIGLYESILLLALIPIVISLPVRRWLLPWLTLGAFGLAEFAIEFGRVGELTRFTGGWRWGWLLFAAVATAIAMLQGRRPWRHESLVDGPNEHAPPLGGT